MQSDPQRCQQCVDLVMQQIESQMAIWPGGGGNPIIEHLEATMQSNYPQACQANLMYTTYLIAPKCLLSHVHKQKSMKAPKTRRDPRTCLLRKKRQFS